MKKKILIVIANYYKDISGLLVNSAKKELDKFSKVKIIEVPGVFEIPVTIIRNIKKFDGFVALGCVIKGETQHFEFISRSTTPPYYQSLEKTQTMQSLISLAMS